jgi:hypothetical protein
MRSASSLATVCAVGVLSTGVAQGQDRSYHFNIANGYLSQALRNSRACAAANLTESLQRITGVSIAPTARAPSIAAKPGTVLNWGHLGGS